MSSTSRVFLSVDIEDDELLSRIAHIQSKLDRQSAKMKIVERENIHFTLRFLGDTSHAKLEEIRESLSGIQFSPFTIRINGIGAFVHGCDGSLLVKPICRKPIQVLGVCRSRNTYHSRLSVRYFLMNIMFFKV